MQEEFALWKKWLAENVCKGAEPAKQKQENKLPQLSDSKRADEQTPAWPTNMPYGC